MPDRSVVYRLRADVTQFRAGLAQASAATKKAADDMTAATKQGAKFRQGLDTVGRASGKIGLVAAAGLGAVVLVAARFDKAMSAVQAATHETAGNMDKLRAAALKAGADTQYSASEAAGGIEELAKAGISTKDILAGGLSGALNLAASGAISVKDAAETAATAMTQFKLSGDQVNHVADLLSAGAAKAQGGVGDLGMALKQSGLVAAQTGLTIDETVGALAEFANAGLIGSDAGTSFKTMLQALTPNGIKAKEAMQQLGISAYDAQGNFVGMTKFAASLRDGLSSLSVEQQNAALKTIFGSDAVRAASIIFRDGAKGVDEWQKKVFDAGHAAETAATRMDNLAGDFEQFKGSLETALIGAGEGSQGPLRKLTQGATEVVNAFSSLPGPAKSAATGLLGVTAVLGAGIWAGNKVVAGIASMRTALTALGITAEGTRAKMALIGTGGIAAAAGLGTLVDTLNQMDSLHRSGDAADATVKSFQDLSDALSYSNVGKYADDLHINLGRLTQDLYQNGTSGDYAKRVLDALGESSHGFGAMLNAQAGAILPFYTANADKASSANKDLGAIIKNNVGALGQGSRATSSAATATKQYAAAAQASAIQSAAVRKAANATARSFVGLGKDLNNSKVSLNSWIHQLAAQADALNNFANNARRAGKRGLRDGLIKELQHAGPEGALRLKQLANGTDAQIARANRAFARGQRAVAAFVRAVSGVKSPPPVNLRVSGAQAAVAAAHAVMSALNAINPFKQVTIQTKRTHIGDPMATGGYVSGPGGPRDDMIPAMLSNGEFVVNAAATSRNYSLLKQINAQKYADGGLVQRFADGGDVSARRRHNNDNSNDKASHHTNKFAEALKRATASLEKEKAARDDLVSKRNDLSSGVRDQFLSDPFAAGNVWASGGGNPQAILKADIAKANAFKSVLYGLKKKGLDGQALASVASTGDIGKAQALSAMGKAGVAQFESLFNQRAKAAGSVGAYAGAAVYGAAITRDNTQLVTLNATVHRLEATIRRQHKQAQKNHKANADHTGKAVAKGVNKAASTGTRGSRGRR